MIALFRLVLPYLISAWFLLAVFNAQGASPNTFSDTNARLLEHGYVPTTQIAEIDPSHNILTGKSSAVDSRLTGEAKFQSLKVDTTGLQNVFENVSPTYAESPNYGFSNNTYLLRFSLENMSASHLRLYLEVAYGMLDLVEFIEYDPQSGDVHRRIVSGDSFKFNARLVKHPSFVFPIEIAVGKSAFVLLRVSTTSSSQFPLRIWSQSGFTKHSQSTAAFVGALIGMVFILAVYNFFLYVSLKENSYLYIVSIMLGYAGVIGVLTGYAYFYFYPQSPYVQDISLIVVSNFALAGLCLFSRSFLALKSNAPLLGRLIWYCAIYCCLLMAAGFVAPYKYMIIFTAINVVLCPFLTYCAGIWLTIKRYKPAYFYNLAFLFFVVFAFVFVLGKAGMIPRNELTEYAMHVGAVTTILLLSFALADRVKQEKNEKENAQKNAIDSLIKYRKIYESSLEGMMRVSLEGELISCNPAFVSLMGADSEDALVNQMKYVPDYVPESPEVLDKLITLLREKGLIFAYEVKCKRIDGSSFWAALHARYNEDDNSTRFIDASIVDITEKKYNEEKLNHIATHDSLTGVANRTGFDSKLDAALESSKKNGHLHSLLFMDLDQFKVVNDTCGHTAGDELLKQLAGLFGRHVREFDSIARMGGDEFVILLNDCPLDRAHETAERLRKEVSEHKFLWQEKVFSVGVSIGIVSVDGKAHNATDILSLADTACYAAKDAGRNRVVVHEALSGNIPAHQSQMELAHTVKSAIENDQLVLYKQDILSLSEGDTGDFYEVLVRLPRENEIMLPGSFIPAMERFDSMQNLDYWVIEKYLRWILDHPGALSHLQQANINISGKTLNNDTFERVVSDLFAKYQAPKDKICFEITESEAIHNLARASALVTDMVSKGFRFSLDDFGSGFSSFNCLKALPVDSLKIDGGFIQDIERDEVDKAMVNSIVQVAHTMNVKVTAEYVESAAVLSLVKELGVDFAQGFHIHRPEVLIR